MQLLEGLAAMHGQGRVHGHLSSQTLWLGDNGDLTIPNLGSARSFAQGQERSWSPVDVTLLWVAPERFNPGSLDAKADIWSYGCVLLELISGKVPWHERRFNNSIQAVYHMDTTQDLPALPANCPEGLRDLVRRCLVRDPALRASAQQLLEDPYFAEQEVPEVAFSS